MQYDKDSTSPRRVWFITGCSSGLGAALVRAVLESGDRVVATARDAGTLAEWSAHPDCLTLPFDVTSGAAEYVLGKAVEWGGRVDVIVNNAGAGWLGALEDTSDEEGAECMAVNFHGPLRVMRAAAPLLREQGGGYVINISAAAAIANYPGFALYGAAKAALEAASESYHAELAAFGVKVTLVQPGPFRTGFIGHSLHRTARQSTCYESTVGKFGTLLGKMDGRQPGDPERAAAALVRLVGSGAAPLRLVLGAYAVKKSRDTAAARIRELEAHEALSTGTEFS